MLLVQLRLLSCHLFLGKSYPSSFVVCSHCILSICNFYLFPVLVLRDGFGFDCSSTCSLLSSTTETLGKLPKSIAALVRLWISLPLGVYSFNGSEKTIIFICKNLSQIQHTTIKKGSILAHLFSFTNLVSSLFSPSPLP